VLLATMVVALQIIQDILEDSMNWITLNSIDGIDKIIEASNIKPQVIFKHSTTCSISQMAKARLDRFDNNENKIDFHYLDLLNFRPVSNIIAEKFHVHHESPQILLIKNGECIYDESHMGIVVDDILEKAAN
jgi:bacillithiol system protein YtxJ